MVLARQMQREAADELEAREPIAEIGSEMSCLTFCPSRRCASLMFSRSDHSRSACSCDCAIVAAFPGARVVVFGHLGDGNLHYNVAAPEGADAQQFLANTRAINRIVHDRVVAAGGSISAEHGIGVLKRDELAHYKTPLELELMRRIKSALDPRGLLNPGKVL